MATETTKSIFWQGVRDGAPFVLVIVPFSILFGVVATEAGLNLVEAMAFSVLVIAGAAQFTAVELLMQRRARRSSCWSRAGGQPAHGDVFRLADAAIWAPRRCGSGPWRPI